MSGVTIEVGNLHTFHPDQHGESKQQRGCRVTCPKHSHKNQSTHHFVWMDSSFDAQRNLSNFCAHQHLGPAANSCLSTNASAGDPGGCKCLNIPSSDQMGMDVSLPVTQGPDSAGLQVKYGHVSMRSPGVCGRIQQRHMDWIVRQTGRLTVGFTVFLTLISRTALNISTSQQRSLASG